MQRNMFRIRLLSNFPLSSNSLYHIVQMCHFHSYSCWQTFNLRKSKECHRRTVFSDKKCCCFRLSISRSKHKQHKQTTEASYECGLMDNMDDTPLFPSLANKVVLITGASSGIGAGTAKVFAQNGCRLSLAGRQEQNLRKVAEECCQLGLTDKQVKCFLGDVTDLNFCRTLVESTVKHFGELDVLVNNAGRLLNNTIENLTQEQYDDVMNLNTRSVVFLTQYAVPHLTKTKGCVVNVSSVVGLRAFPGVLAYCMSKAAIDHFTRCAALELAPKGIRVNAVNPGVIKTEVHKRGGMSEQEYKEFLERGKVTHALGRVGEVHEVGHAIAFLASSAASFITGETMPVDGGRHAMCPR